MVWYYNTILINSLNLRNVLRLTRRAFLTYSAALRWTDMGPIARVLRVRNENLFRFTFALANIGAAASLPVMVVAQVGESSAGLAKFRISAGIGLLAGSVGCAVLEAQIGIAALFALIAIVLLGSAQLAHIVGRRMPAT